MTVATTTNRAAYTGNGVTTSFSYPYPVQDAGDLVVLETVIATGVETVKTITTHYTVTIAGGGGSATVDAVTAPASTVTWTIYRDPARTQTLDLVDNDPMPAEEIEDALDKGVMIAQRTYELVARSLRQPDGDSAAIGELPAKVNRIGKLLQFNSTTGDPEVVAAADLSLATVTPFAETLLDDTTAAAARSTLGAGAVGANVFTAATAAAAQQAMDTEVGVDVQAYDADLTAIAALSHSRGRVAASNGSAWVAYDNLLPDNLLINGDFDVWQLGTSFTGATSFTNNDDNYCADQWIILSDGNDIIDVTKETTTIPSTGALAAIALDVETANKKFGIFQPIEQRDAIAVIGGTVSLAFEARKGSSNATVGSARAALVAWGGTADSITSDIVSAWNGSGTNPTLVANWTYENTPADLTLTTSYQEFRIENVSLDTANAKNLGLFLFYNNADGTVGDFIYISKVRLVPGAVATPAKRRTFDEELSRCERLFEKTFDLGTAPAQAAGLLGSLTSIAISGSTGPVCTWQFKTRKRVAPTLTTYSPHAANANWRDTGNSTTVAVSIIASTGENAATIGAGAAAGATANYHIHAIADARL